MTLQSNDFSTSVVVLWCTYLLSRAGNKQEVTVVTVLEEWHLMPCSIYSWNLSINVKNKNLSINVKNKARNVFQMATTLANNGKQENYVVVLYFMETSVGYFDIIYSMHLYWIKLFIHDTNKCSFDIYTNTVLCHSCMFWLPEDVITPKRVGAV
jgi:hypothetical protein